MAKKAVKEKKVKAKDLYTELDMSFSEFKERAESLGITVKAWNSSLGEKEAEALRAAAKGQSLALDVGLEGQALSDVSEALNIDLSAPSDISEADTERLKACSEAYELSQELDISFEELQKLGNKIGIEIGRVGYKGLTKPEALLLKAQYRTHHQKAESSSTQPEAKEVPQGPQFAAPTGNKALESELKAKKKSPEAKGSSETPKRGGRRRSYRNEDLPSESGAPKGGSAQRSGRRRFEVRESAYANQRSMRREQTSKFRTPSSEQLKQEMPTGPITISLPINLRQLSEALGTKVSEIQARLMQEKMLIRINDSLSQEMIENISLLLEREITVKAPKSAEELIEDELDRFEEEQDDLIARAPIVTIMGHVDHGKTSLLDAINKMDRAGDESGGITQHIGAFRVEVEREEGQRPIEVVFIDTPGHEAFTAMRARGAQVTDVVVIVVAADDGIMPQTEEAIDHAKAANVEVVVAINKIDKPEANVQRTRQMLAKHNLMSPDWGGTTEILEVSAISGEGIPELVQTLSDLTELLELKANPQKPAAGVVLEAHLSEGRGIVATVLVQEGTLKKGEAIVAGHGFGKVRSMHDSRGRELERAEPSMPIQVAGLSSLPEAGSRFHQVNDLRKAQEIARKVTQQEKELARASEKPLTLEAWSQERQDAAVEELRIVLKTDVQGTAETIKTELEKFEHDEVGIKVIRAAVGTVTTNDVRLAEASNAIILSFNATVQPKAIELADKHHVEIRQYEVIYKLLEDIHAALSGLLKPEEVEVELGRVEIRKLFRASKIGMIAGCFVTDGVIRRNARVRLYRGDELLYNGPLASLKRFQDEVKEVREGFDCGIVLLNYADIQEGDILRPYVIEARERTLGT